MAVNRVRGWLIFAAMVAVLASCSSGGGQSPAQAKAQITTVWQTLFSPNGSPDQIQGMNSQLRQAYQKVKPPAGLTANVKSVQLLSSSECSTNGVPSPCARVTYDLDAGGKAILANSQGYAARVGGKWLVSKTTFCALVALSNGGKPPAGC